MDGVRETIYTLRLLAQCNRLTRYERDCIKYALIILEDYVGESNARSITGG